MKFFFSFIIFIFLSFNSLAQFYTVGDDPASLRWYKTESEHFSIIYPEGLDSLAKVYGQNLEKYRIAVGRSAGYTPGEYICTKIPVVLHSWNAQSNGSVAWAPKRMDLFTLPQAYGPEALPWEKTLAIHESRHVAQMQFGLSHVFKLFKYVFGEMLDGAAAGIYPGKWLLEGDAVIAETALTHAGRGRSGDFLNYFMAAFDNGDFRNFYRWNYGSYKYFTPDEYALGYMMISGIRYKNNTPHYTDIYLRHAAKKPYDVLIHRSTSRKISGKSFKSNFEDAINLHHCFWTEEKEARKPFIKAGPASDAKNMKYTVYSGNVFCGGVLWSIKNSLNKSNTLVKIDSYGHEKEVSSFAPQSSKLEASPDGKKLFWSEIKSDRRWKQKKFSIIRQYDIERKRTKNLTQGTRYFHPSSNADGSLLAVTEYLVQGGSRIVILDSKTGKEQKYVSAPDSLQIVESVWIGKKLFVSAISESGFGIYSASAEKIEKPWKCEIEPQPVQIKDLRNHENTLTFTCDRTGVNELYSLSDEGVIFRLTSTEYGADNFQFSPDEKQLFFSSAGHQGKIIMKTSVNELSVKKVVFSDIHRYRIADELSEQEVQLAESGESMSRIAKTSDSKEVSFTQPVRYKKFNHLFNIHSWAPIYFNYDNITQFSYDYIYELASLGATALIQNRLGTMTGFLGYSAHKDPYKKSIWRHSGHLKFTYSGLYPVIEASLDINDRAAIKNSLYSISDDSKTTLHLNQNFSDKPYIDGKVSVYIPLDFSSGGWSKGIIPKVSWNITNDSFDYSFPHYTKDDGNNSERLIQSIQPSLRLYAIRNSSICDIYPDFGIGAEAGVKYYAGNTKFLSPSVYAYAYGYLPGITREQGLNLSVLWQHNLRNSYLIAPSVNTLPRGLSSEISLRNHVARYRHNTKISANYAIPIYLGDFNISSLFYVKRAVVTPHFDLTLLGRTGNLFSAGITATIEFGCFFWIGVPVSIGATYSYNGGKSFNHIKDSGVNISHHFIGPAFKLSLPQ